MSFLATFHHTTDSWLLSLAPIYAALFATVGDAPAVVVATGWAIFVAAVAMAFLAVRLIAGPVPALGAAVVLLLSNADAIGEAGFLTYPVSHNISLLWGLLALYAAMRAQGGGGWWPLLVFVALALAGLSDPWTEAAFTGPLLIAAGSQLLPQGPRTRAPALLLMAATAGAIVTVHTKLFGLMAFVPSSPFRLAAVNEIGPGLAALARLGAAWFEVVPGEDDAGHARMGAAAILTGLAFPIAGTYAAARLAALTARASAAFRLLCLTAATSGLGTMAAFVAFDVPKVEGSGRYFMAVYVLGVMVFATAIGRAWPAIGPLGRIAAIGYALTLPVASLLGHPPQWTPYLRPTDHGVGALAGAVAAEGLSFGFGPYWGTQANAAAWVTRGAVVIRPVTFETASGRVSPRRMQTSPTWYAPAGPPDQTTFLAIPPDHDAGCPAVAPCVEAAERQFGAARRTFALGPTRILVYDFPLLAASDEALAAHVATVPLGQDIVLAQSGSGFVLGRGWGSAGAAGTASDGDRASLLLHLPAPQLGPIRLSLSAWAATRRGIEARDVRVSMRGRELARWQVRRNRSEEHNVTIPADLMPAGIGALELAAVDPERPGEGLDLVVRSLRMTLVSAP